jgi:hypothetical protein
MRKRTVFAVSIALLCGTGLTALPAVAQDAFDSNTACTSITSNGNAHAGMVPIFTAACNIGASTITERSSGVGIGTTSPAANLHVVGGASTKLLVESSVANGNPGIQVVANTPAGEAYFSASRADGGATAGLYLDTAGSLNWAVEVAVGDTNQLNISNSSDAPSMTFLQGGQVGVGTQTPANTLEIVTGGTTLADAWTTRSSRQFKANIQPLVGALEKVEQLQGVSYERKADGKHEIGVIAEDVDQIVPEVVSRDPNTHQVQGVDYSRLAALLIEAVKSEQTQIQSQQAEIQQLKAQIGQLIASPARQ